MQKFDPKLHPSLCALDEKVKALLSSERARAWSVPRMEFELCRIHPVYWMEQYGRIRPGELELGAGVAVDGGVVPFILNPVQLIIADKICAHLVHEPFQRVQVIILKHRKAGISTLVAAFDYWHMRFFENLNAFVIADLAKHTDNIVGMIDIFHKGDTCGQGAREVKCRPVTRRPMPQNKKGIRITNGSMVEQDSGDTPNPGTSGTVNVLHMSENSKWGAADSAEASLLNSVPRRGYVFIVKESTAYGVNKFAQDCDDAFKQKSSWEPIFISWLDMPDCCDETYPGESLELAADERELQVSYPSMTTGHLKFRRRQIDLLGSAAIFKQDFPLNPREPFLVSGANFFNTVAVQQRIDEVTFYREWKARGIEVLREKFPDILTRIKHHPRGEREALARLEDNNVTPEVVTLTENLGHVSYVSDPKAKLVEGAGLMFRRPKRHKTYLVVVDVAEGKRSSEYVSDNSIIEVFDCFTGEQVFEWGGVFDEEMTADYAEMISSIYNEALICPEMNNKCGGLLWGHLQSRCPRRLYYREVVRGQKHVREAGWDTKAGVKRDVLGTFRLAFKNGDCLLHSVALLEEMLYFMDVGGRLGAAEGKLDDRVMASGVALKVVSITPSLRRAENKAMESDLDLVVSTPAIEHKRRNEEALRRYMV